MLQQAYDFCDESNAIYELLSNIDDDQFNKSTLFKGWTFNNVIGHLHVWNYAADISLKDGEEWKEFSNNVLKAFGSGATFSQFEETIISKNRKNFLQQRLRRRFPGLRTRTLTIVSP